MRTRRIWNLTICSLHVFWHANDFHNRQTCSIKGLRLSICEVSAINMKVTLIVALFCLVAITSATKAPKFCNGLDCPEYSVLETTKVSCEVTCVLILLLSFISDFFSGLWTSCIQRIAMGDDQYEGRELRTSYKAHVYAPLQIHFRQQCPK